MLNFYLTNLKEKLQHYCILQVLIKYSGHNIDLINYNYIAWPKNTSLNLTSNISAVGKLMSFNFLTDTLQNVARS